MKTVVMFQQLRVLTAHDLMNLPQKLLGAVLLVAFVEEFAFGYQNPRPLQLARCERARSPPELLEHIGSTRCCANLTNCTSDTLN